MTKGQLGTAQDTRQSKVEKQLGYLATVLAILEHDHLRVEQAIRRTTGLRDLLTPVLTDYKRVELTLRDIQAELRATWDEGQETRWNLP